MIDRDVAKVNNENEFLNQKAVFELFSNCVMIIWTEEKEKRKRVFGFSDFNGLIKRQRQLVLLSRSSN